MNNPRWLLEGVERYEIAAYSECFKKKPHMCLPRRLVDLAYSQEGVDCLIYADDCWFMFNAVEMEKTRFISRNDPVDKNVYITCFCI